MNWQIHKTQKVPNSPWRKGNRKRFVKRQLHIHSDPSMKVSKWSSDKSAYNWRNTPIRLSQRVDMVRQNSRTKHLNHSENAKHTERCYPCQRCCWWFEMDYVLVAMLMRRSAAGWGPFKRWDLYGVEVLRWRRGHHAKCDGAWRRRYRLALCSKAKVLVRI